MVHFILYESTTRPATLLGAELVVDQHHCRQVRPSRQLGYRPMNPPLGAKAGWAGQRLGHIQKTHTEYEGVLHSSMRIPAARPTAASPGPVRTATEALRRLAAAQAGLNYTVPSCLDPYLRPAYEGLQSLSSTLPHG